MESNFLLNVEYCFLAQLWNYPQYLETTPVLANYFSDKKCKLLFELMKKCYKENKTLDIHLIIKEQKTKEFIDFVADIVGDTFYWNVNVEKNLAIYEKQIIKNYKMRIIDGLEKQKSNGKIDYEQYVSKIKELDAIKVMTSEKTMLTTNDVDMGQEEIKEKILSGIKDLDSSIKGFTMGQLSIWSGGNASAKSTFLNQLAIESINQGYKVAIYSGELTIKRLLGWIISQCAGKKYMNYNRQKDYYYVEPVVKERIIKWLNDKLYIYDNAKGNKANNVINGLRYCVNDKGIKVVIIDNLMSIDIGNENKYDLQSQFIQQLSNLAKELDIHIHFVCHPRKTVSFLRKTDISGTADLTNIADNVFIMHRTNNDFKIKTKEMFKWSENHPIYDYSNVIEVCKNRDYGVEDAFIGMYYEPISRRLMNSENEEKHYKWEVY